MLAATHGVDRGRDRALLADAPPGSGRLGGGDVRFRAPAEVALLAQRDRRLSRGIEPGVPGGTIAARGQTSDERLGLTGIRAEPGAPAGAGCLDRQERRELPRREPGRASGGADDEGLLQVALGIEPNRLHRGRARCGHLLGRHLDALASGEQRIEQRLLRGGAGHDHSRLGWLHGYRQGLRVDVERTREGGTVHTSGDAGDRSFEPSAVDRSVDGLELPVGEQIERPAEQRDHAAAAHRICPLGAGLRVDLESGARCPDRKAAAGGLQDHRGRFDGRDELGCLGFGAAAELDPGNGRPVENLARVERPYHQPGKHPEHEQSGDEDRGPRAPGSAAPCRAPPPGSAPLPRRPALITFTPLDAASLAAAELGASGGDGGERSDPRDGGESAKVALGL